MPLRPHRWTDFVIFQIVYLLILENVPSLICSTLKMTSSYYSPGSWTGNLCLLRQAHHPEGHLSIRVLTKLPFITLSNRLLISRMSILLAAKIARQFFLYQNTLSNRSGEGKFFTEVFLGGHDNFQRGAPVGFFPARIPRLVKKSDRGSTGE